MKVDINLLPEEYRPKRWALPLTIGLIIVILAAGYWGYTSFAKKAVANSELDQLQSQLDSVNAELQQVTSGSGISVYQQQIADTQAQIDKLQALEDDYEYLSDQRVIWRPVIQTIRERAPTDVTLTNFEQNGDEISVEGELASGITDATIIIAYRQQLDSSGIFSRITVEIGTEEITTEDGKTEDIYVFTMLLEVK